jgi:hypothetical protein
MLKMWKNPMNVENTLIWKGLERELILSHLKWTPFSLPTPPSPNPKKPLQAY